MQPLATKVDLAESPVADGVALVPVIVTVFDEYAVVSPVPSRAAKRTNTLSTDVCVKAQLLRITLPCTLRNEVPSVNVVSAAVPPLRFIEALETAPIDWIDGNVRVVNAPKNCTVMLPCENPVPS